MADLNHLACHQTEAAAAAAAAAAWLMIMKSFLVLLAYRFAQIVASVATSLTAILCHMNINIYSLFRSFATNWPTIDEICELSLISILLAYHIAHSTIDCRSLVLWCSRLTTGTSSTTRVSRCLCSYQIQLSASMIMSARFCRLRVMHRHANDNLGTCQPASQPEHLYLLPSDKLVSPRISLSRDDGYGKEEANQSNLRPLHACM